MYLRLVKQLSDALRRHPHFVRYLEEWAKKGRGMPEFHENLRARMRTMEEFNFVYPVKPPDFIHAYKSGGGRKEYIIIEPHLSEEGLKSHRILLDEFQHSIADNSAVASGPDRWSFIHQFLKQNVTTRRIPEPGWLRRNIGLAPPPKTYVSEGDLDVIALYLDREMTGRGVLTPMVIDPYLNELNAIGAGRLEVVHKVWGAMEVGRRFRDATELDGLLEREAIRPGPTKPPEHPLTFRTSRGKTGIIHR